MGIPPTPVVGGMDDRGASSHYVLKGALTANDVLIVILATPKDIWARRPMRALCWA